MNNETYKIKLNMDAFSQAFEDYCYCEQSFKLYAKQYSKIKYTKEYFDNRVKYDRDYWVKYAESNAAWDSMRFLCQLVNLDCSAVLSVFKSIRRNMQYQNNWEREARFSDDRYFYWEDKKAGSVESFVELCKA